MSNTIEKLKEAFGAPGWKDEVVEQFEKVQILEESAADMDELLEICKHLHLLSIMSRKGRKVGFADEGDPLRASAQAAVLCFERCAEICERLQQQEGRDFRVVDQLNRSYYGISDILLRAGKAHKQPETKRRLLMDSRKYAQMQRDLLDRTIAQSKDPYERDFAGQFIDISDMQLEDIDDCLNEMNG